MSSGHQRQKGVPAHRWCSCARPSRGEAACLIGDHLASLHQHGTYAIARSFAPDLTGRRIISKIWQRLHRGMQQRLFQSLKCSSAALRPVILDSFLQ
jgi:hypothetical protein